MFKHLKDKVQKRLDFLIKDGNSLFTTDLDKDLIYQTYLNSFLDPIEKQDHTCNCCRQFLKYFGDLVIIKNNKLETLWDFEENDPEYSNTVLEMRKLVLKANISNIFVSKEQKLGTEKSLQRFTVDAITKKQISLPIPIVWEHFFITLPKNLVVKSALSPESIMGTARDMRNVFQRSLEEITLDAAETVLELMNQGSLYKGDEFKPSIVEFIKCKKEYKLIENKELYCWEKYSKTYVSKIRNSAIGTLLTSLTEGKDLDVAVTSFERLVAPSNYKRPKAIVTSSMINEAEKVITELGLTDSLYRRFANVDDISVENLLFVNRDVKKAVGIFEELKEDVTVNPKTLSKIEEIHIDDFIKNILPTAKGIELLLESGQLPNMMSLITGVNPEAKPLFKWNNNFSWSYTNSLTDSMKEKVKEAGGNVDGVLRYSIQWNEDGKSICDLDAHATQPDNITIKYSSPYRKDKGNVKTNMSGQLDVDMINPSGVGVENITWTDLLKMKEGNYTFQIHNFNDGRNSGYKAEIEFNGEIFEFEETSNFQGLKTVATVEYSKLNGFKLLNEEKSHKTISTKEKWGIETNKFYKVNMLMNSPNYWNENSGNKHIFFIIDGLKNSEEPRGIFNEFLTEDLLKNKRFFELLGGKMKVESSDKQLSGVGFSTTQRNKLICRVDGKFKRLLKIIF